MKKNEKLIWPAVMALITAGCGSEPPPFDPTDYTLDPYVEPTYEFNDITWDKMADTSISDGDYVSVEGYIGAFDDLFLVDNSSLKFDLFPRRGQSEGFCIKVKGTTGDDPNSIQELPENYGSNSLRIVCDDSTIVRPGDFVRVSCEVSIKDRATFWADMIKIEKIDKDWSEDELASAVALTPSITRDTSKDETYSYVDGKLTLPDAFMSMYGRVRLDLKGSSCSAVKEVSVKMGNGPSTADSPPDYYSSDDLVFRDCQGTALGYTDKVRIYGVWKWNSDKTEGTFYAEEMKKI